MPCRYSFSLLAGGDVGWGGGMPHNNSKVLQEVGLIMPGGDGIKPNVGGAAAFQFPSALSSVGGVAGGRSSGTPEELDDGPGGNNSSSEPSPISKVDRSNSTPNVSHTITTSAMGGGDGGPLPVELFRYL